MNEKRSEGEGVKDGELTDRCSREAVWQSQQISLDLQVRRIHHEFDRLLVLIPVHVRRILSIYN